MHAKLIVICPSRGRPKILKEMIESFVKTARISTLRVCLDNDDPDLEEYRAVIGHNCPYLIDIHKTTTETINDQFQSATSQFTHISVSNDDFLFHTEGWDERLISEIASKGGTGIAYGNDLLAGQNLPTMSVISSNIIKELGWIQMPRLTHLCGDVVWKIIGTKAKCIYYRQDVIIEHRHVFAHKMQIDETHKKTNSTEMYHKDNDALEEWIKAEMDSDVLKVKNILTK